MFFANSAPPLRSLRLKKGEFNRKVHKVQFPTVIGTQALTALKYRKLRAAFFELHFQAAHNVSVHLTDPAFTQV